MGELIFSAQHNGNGKNHLIGEDDEREICGSAGIFLFTSACEIHLKDGKFYEEFMGVLNPIPDCIIEVEYCKKCIKKAIARHIHLKS